MLSDLIGFHIVSVAGVKDHVDDDIGLKVSDEPVELIEASPVGRHARTRELQVPLRMVRFEKAHRTVGTASIARKSSSGA
jgi:hypothetical protein